MPGAPAHDSGVLVLRTPAALGALRSLRERLLGADRPVAVVDRAAPGRVERGAPELAHALEVSGADLAAPAGGTDLAGLLAHPRSLGVLALAPGLARRLGLPDFGPPDLFLEDHATWAVATALLIRGARGVAVPGGHRLAGAGPSAHGAAWLAAAALNWSPEGGIAEGASEAWRRLVER